MSAGRDDRDAGAEKAFAAERGIAGIRAAIVSLNSFAYLALLDHKGTMEGLAVLIVVTAHVYAYGVYFARPYRRFPVMMSSWFTTALDAVFITLWLVATGAAASPFYVLWYVSVTAVAFRFGARETMVAAFVYAACDLAVLGWSGTLLVAPGEALVRIAYIFFIAATGAFFAREAFRQTREKLAARRLAGELRDSENRFRTLSDATFEGIAVHERGRILHANRAFGELFGYRPEEVVGMSALDFVAEESWPDVERRLKAPADEPYEVTARRRDGTRFSMELAAKDLPYHGRMVRVVAARDVTERKQRVALQASNDQLRELDRMKSQFINAAAHELNSPLTPIKLQSHLLRVGSLGPLNEKQQRAVGVVARNADHLTHLVRDVLDSARVQGGRLAIERAPLDVRRLVEDARESFEEAARIAGVRIVTETAAAAEVPADAKRVNQVLFNLLSNALKFTTQGGEVRVRTRLEEGGVVVEVQDDGEGIDPTHLDRLFTPFTQVHDTTLAGRGGSGLGLYISRGIVEGHGGRIWATSAGRGQGSTFAFFLPASA